MSNQIHSTAIIGNDVVLGTGNIIGPHVVMQGKIIIGDRNTFEVGCHLSHDVIIGDQNHFFSNVQIGGPGEMGRKGDKLFEGKGVRIGNRNQLRENVIVHSPFYNDSTQIENDNYIMNGAYIAHDVQIANHCVINARVTLGGRVRIGSYVTIGMQASVHQRMHIGDYAMIGMLTPITRAILPGVVVAGNPSRIHRINSMLFEQLGWRHEDMKELIDFIISSGEKKFKETHPLYSVITTMLTVNDNVLWKMTENNPHIENDDTLS